MRFIANLALLSAALVAGGCASHCGGQDCCEAPSCCGGCGAPAYVGGTGNGTMAQPMPETPPMEPAEVAPAPPPE